MMSVRCVHILCNPSQDPPIITECSLVPHSLSSLHPLPQATTDLISVITNELACFKSHVSGIVQKIFFYVWFFDTASNLSVAYL